MSVQLPLTKKRLDLLLSRAEELCVEKKMTKSLALYTIAVNQGFDSWEMLLEAHREYQSAINMLSTSIIVCIPSNAYHSEKSASDVFVSSPNLNTLCQSHVYDYLMQKSPNTMIDALGNYSGGDVSERLEAHISNLTCFSYIGKEQTRDVDLIESLVTKHICSEKPIYIFDKGNIHVFFSNETRINEEHIYLVSSL